MKSLRYILESFILFIGDVAGDHTSTDDSWAKFFVALATFATIVGCFLLFRWVSKKYFKSWLSTVMAWVFTIAACAIIAVGIIVVELIVTK